MADLKPCPFCGGEAELFQHYPYMRRRVVSSVCCKSCRANSGTWGRKDKAIEAWNTRKPMEAAVAAIKEKHCKKCRNILGIAGAEEYCKEQKCEIEGVCEIVRNSGKE